jgi:hypothetical protein
MMTGYGLHGPRSIPGTSRFFFSPQRSAFPIRWVPGAPPPGIKRQGHEADHSPPSSAEVKNGGALPPLPHMS